MTLTIVKHYDEYGRATTHITYGNLSILIDGHSVDLTDRRLKPLWDNLKLDVRSDYVVAA